MKTVPEQIKTAAKQLIQQYGDAFEYLGTFQDKDAFLFAYPEDVDAGYPVVYLWDGKTVDEVTDFIALNIVNTLVED